MSAFSRFTCEEAFRRLDDFLDCELSPDDMTRVQEHLEICAGCAREFNFEASVLRNVRSKLRQFEPPPALESFVRDLVAREFGAGEVPGRPDASDKFDEADTAPTGDDVPPH